MISPADFFLLAPEIVLATAGLLLLLVGSIGRGLGNRESAGFAILGLLLTLGFAVWLQLEHLREPRIILAGTFILDRFALFC